MLHILIFVVELKQNRTNEKKYKNMIQFVTICDDLYGKLMSYDTVNIPKCAQGSILHV